MIFWEPAGAWGLKKEWERVKKLLVSWTERQNSLDDVLGKGGEEDRISEMEIEKEAVGDNEIGVRANENSLFDPLGTFQWSTTRVVRACQTETVWHFEDRRVNWM